MHISLLQKKNMKMQFEKQLLFIRQELKIKKAGFMLHWMQIVKGRKGNIIFGKEEVDDILGSDSELFCAFFDITEDGNWEEKKHILNITTFRG